MKKFKNLGYTFIGNISIAFVKWLILIIIVRMTNPEEVGNYTFSMALTAPLLLFINMRLRTRYVVEDDLSFKSIQRIRTLTSGVALISITSLAYLFFEDLLIYIVLISFLKLLDLQSELYYSIYHKNGNFKAIGQNQLMKSLLTILFFTGIMFLTTNVKYALIAQILAQLIWLIVFERKSLFLLTYNEREETSNNLLSLFLVGVPLGFVQLINSYNILIPRYFIEGFLSIGLVGIFASISYLLTIVDLFMNAISQNIILHIKKNIFERNFEELNDFISKKVILYFLLIMMFLPLIIYFSSEMMINLIYGDEYAKYYMVLVIISFAIGFNFLSWIYDTTLMAFKTYKSQVYVSVFTLMVSISSSLILIRIFGIYGAAGAIVIISSVQATAKFILLKIVLLKNKNEINEKL